MKEVTLFTDGSCLGNPGPGGWACILRYGKHERILRGVEPHTTNNRMELVAAINGLRALTEACRVTAITDSRYLQQGMTVYLVRWRSLGWCLCRYRHRHHYAGSGTMPISKLAIHSASGSVGVDSA